MFNRRSSTPVRKNDGLPTVNGKKFMNRRRRFGLLKNDIPDDDSKDSSFLRYAYYIILLVFPLLVLYAGQQQDLSLANEEQKAAVSAASAKPKATVSQTPALIEPGGGYGYPEKCTSAEIKVLKHQLPTEELIHRTWRDSSFTIATKRSSFAYNPILMRQFYASDRFNLNKEHGFFGVLVNMIDNEIAFDTYAIGSRDKKFDPKQWYAELDHDGKLPLESVEISGASNPARVLVVDWDESKQPAVSLQHFKASFGLSDDQIALATIEKKNVLEKDVLADLIRDNAPKINGSSSSTQPIHFLDIMCGSGCYSDLLYSLRPLWKVVRYVHFEYDKSSNEFSQPQKLSIIIEDLKAEGLLCYFAGKKETDYGLWRITDCFLDYYDHPHWSEIACVNALQDDVKTLVREMEEKFHETLKKDHTFPSDLN